MVSVGPYQLNSRTSGQAARSRRASPRGKGSPAKAQTRSAGGGAPSSSPPWRSISTRTEGTEYQTVNRWLSSRSVSSSGAYAMPGGTRCTEAPTRNAA